MPRLPVLRLPEGAGGPLGQQARRLHGVNGHPSKTLFLDDTGSG
jgi:hypothetical protein